MSRPDAGPSANDARDEQPGPGLAPSQDRAERSEIQRYLIRLMLILFVAAMVMAAVGLYTYRAFHGERGETTRRVPVTRQVGPSGSVQYLPVGDAPRE